MRGREGGGRGAAQMSEQTEEAWMYEQTEDHPQLPYVHEMSACKGVLGVPPPLPSQRMAVDVLGPEGGATGEKEELIVTAGVEIG